MTLFIGAIPGILVAFVLALINLAQRAANPAIDVLATNDSPADSLLEEAPAGRRPHPESLSSAWRHRSSSPTASCSRRR